MRIGFDNDKYIALQAEHIRERIGQFGGKSLPRNIKKHPLDPPKQDGVPGEMVSGVLRRNRKEDQF